MDISMLFKDYLRFLNNNLEFVLMYGLMLDDIWYYNTIYSQILHSIVALYVTSWWQLKTTCFSNLAFEVKVATPNFDRFLKLTTIDFCLKCIPTFRMINIQIVKWTRKRQKLWIQYICTSFLWSKNP